MRIAADELANMQATNDTEVTVKAFALVSRRLSG